MLDDEARRALEQEAIALVNLSNSQPLTKKRPAPSAAEAFVGSKRLQHQPPPLGVHPLLQENKATLMARRDDRRASHPHRVNTAAYRPPSVGASGGVVQLKPLLAQRAHLHEPRLSMSVFVNTDGQLREVASSGKASPDHHAAAFELTPLDPTGAVKQDVSVSPTTTTTAMTAITNAATSDSHISMQSLLVNLKKRKADDSSSNSSGSATKLPRFRDVFEPTRPERPPMPSITMQAAPTVSYTTAVAAVVSAPSSPSIYDHDHDAPVVEDSTYPPPPELKCKYRTGKCGNARALKSCGDYHNLCNYHRLRANANQRKLDRKKKVQRGQPSGTTDSSSEATSPVAAPTASAAASTLASLPTATSFLVSRATQPSSAGPHRASAPFLTYLVPPSGHAGLQSTSSLASSSSSSSLLRPKPEAKSC